MTASIRRKLVALGFAFLLVPPVLPQAAAPRTIAHQGYLTTSTGIPVNGTVAIAFALYAAPAGGEPLWSESQDVAVANGHYSAVLGSVVPIELPFDAPYWLGIKAGGDAEMTPRQALAGVPYAFQARRSEAVPACTEGSVLVFTAGAWQCGSMGVFPNAAAVCVGEQCTISGCAAGLGNCDANVANGCETPLASTVQHCGACGNDCNALGLPNVATYSCGSSQCSIASCAVGFANVNGVQADGCESACSPNDDPDAALDDSNCDGIDGDISKSFFVRTNGSDTNPGTIAAPFRTINRGITAAAADGVRKNVLVAAGTYNEIVTLASGVNVYGGYNASWVRSTGGQSGVAIEGGFAQSGVYLTVRGSSLASPVTIADLRIVGPDAVGQSASGTGSSSYAVHLQSANLLLVRVRIEAGNGAAGAAGSPGTSASQFAAQSGGMGGSGSTIAPGSCNATSAGAGGTAGTGAGVGGGGGTADTSCSGGLCVNCNARSGNAGANAAIFSGGSYGAGGAGGPANSSGCDTGGGTPGGIGLPGRAQANGAGGQGGIGSGQIASGFWVAASGNAGSLGEDGTGGGGGGGGGGCDAGSDAYGPGGGGGGAGGARAPQAGGNGRGGGGSFGVFAVDSTVTVTDSVLVRASAGAGGNGGAGGTGQPGGGGGTAGARSGNASSAAGAGGAGSRGGHSGGGGGGAGGISYQIYSSGSTIAQSGTNTFSGSGGGGSPGSGGAAATGGTSGQGGGTGATGSAGNIGTCASLAAC